MWPYPHAIVGFPAVCCRLFSAHADVSAPAPYCALRAACGRSRPVIRL